MAGVHFSSPANYCIMKEYKNYRYRNRRHRKTSVGSSLITTILTSIASFAAKDLMSENSKIKRIISNITNPKQITRAKQPAIEAEYSVLSEELEKKQENTGGN